MTVFRWLLVFFSVLLLFNIGAQSMSEGKSGINKIDNYEVLPDRHYKFQQILSDSSLNWLSNGNLTPNKCEVYWLRFRVNKADQAFTLVIFPFIKNTLYQFDRLSNSWIESTSGLLLNNRERSFNTFFIDKNLQKNIFLYLKVDLSSIKAFSGKIRPSLQLKSHDEFTSYEQRIWVVWIITVSILLIFILYSLILFFISKDLTYLFYFIVLVGGGIYATSHHKIVNELLGFRWVKFNLDDQGVLYFFDLNTLINRIGAVIVVFGLVQLTRYYLSTWKNTPKIDKFLKYGICCYITIVCFSSIITALTEWYIDPSLVLIQNLLAALIIILIFSATITTLQRSFRIAYYFLLSNSLPLLFVFGIAIYYAINKVQGNYSMFLPNFAIVSMTLAFAFALASRFIYINEELQTQKKVADNLKLSNNKIFIEKQRIEVENKRMQTVVQYEKAKTESLQLSLDARKRELVSSALHKTKNREMLEDLNKHLDALSKNLNPKAKEEHLKEAKSILKNNLLLDSNWDSFKLHFEQVHTNFFTDLLSKHPNLTSNELRLCAYLHINLSVKEIAILQNIDPASVRKAKMRLNKKLNSTH